MTKYLANCFLLILPLLFWNIIFIGKLPKTYTSKEILGNIPSWVEIVENILRGVVFMLPLLMQLSFRKAEQKIGLILYVVGLLVYFFSWIAQMHYPSSPWSKSMMGYMAPAYTTILFFIGIGMIGQQSFVNIPNVGLIYMIISLLFVLVHTYNSYLVYNNI